MGLKISNTKLNSLVKVTDFPEGSVLRLIAEGGSVPLALEVALQFGGKQVDAYISTYGYSISNAEKRLKDKDWNEYVNVVVAKQEIRNENKIKAEKIKEGADS